MLSRVANSLFWLARYLERAENCARFMWVTHGYAQELRGVSHGAAECCWPVAWRLITGSLPEGELPPTPLRDLCFDLETKNSLLATITRARENARGIRDTVSSEMWEELNVLYLRIQETAGSPRSETADLALLQRLRTASHLFQGLRDNTMVRADEWHFLILGQYLERAYMTARIIELMIGHPAVAAAETSGHNIDLLHLSVTLRACTAFEAYSRAAQALAPASVVEFLLLDARFSRSVEFCVQEMQTSLHALSGTPTDIFTNQAEQVAGRLVAELRFASVEEIMDQGLDPYLGRVQGQLNQIGEGISQEYFR
jgi:uncharacterized alpha-E superfamily protein